jgi:broad specificity phosphatase PhoE
MRWLEVRRHSLTKRGEARGRGSHLSAQGVALARAVGEEVGYVAYVVTSTSPRAIETAVAMGHAVDEAIDLPGGYVDGEVAHHEQWSWLKPYVAYASLIRRGRGLAAAAEEHRAAWVRTIAATEDGEVTLIISHGGAIEPALVACLPDADHASWGAPFAHCDGARLAFDGESFTSIGFLRAPRLPLSGRVAPTPGQVT